MSTKTVKTCACGCGEIVGKGATWRPGHDSRVIPGLIHDVVRGEEAKDRLIDDYGWTEKEIAASVRLRRWP